MSCFHHSLLQREDEISCPWPNAFFWFILRDYWKHLICFIINPKNESSLILGVFGPVASCGLHKGCILLTLQPSQKIYLILFLDFAQAKSCLQVFRMSSSLEFLSISDRKHTVRLLAMVVSLAFSKTRFIIPTDLISLFLNKNNFCLTKKKSHVDWHVLNFL